MNDEQNMNSHENEQNINDTAPESTGETGGVSPAGMVDAAGSHGWKWLPFLAALLLLLAAAAITTTIILVNRNIEDFPDTELGLEGEGSELTPYILLHSGTYVPNAADGKPRLFLYYPSQKGVISVTAVNPGELGIIMTDLTTGEIVHSTDEVKMGVTPDHGVLIELYFLDPEQKGHMPFVFVDEKDGVGRYHESPTVITGTGYYPADLSVGESAHYIYTATGEGFIRVDAPGTTITIRNTTTGAVFMAHDGLSVSVRPGEKLEIELRGDVGLSDDTVNMYFQDEHDYVDASEAAISIETIRRYEKDGTIVDATGDRLALLPGQTIHYEVGAVSKGAGSAWVRLRVDFVFKDKQGVEIPCTDEEIAGLVKLAVNDEHWISLGDDGWWYYDQVLPGHCAAPLLFDSLTLSGQNFTAKFAGCTTEMYVTSQAVQAKGNGHSAVDAQGWPA